MKKSVVFCEDCNEFEFSKHLGRGKMLANCGHEVQVDQYVDLIGQDGYHSCVDLHTGKKNTRKNKELSEAERQALASHRGG